MVSIPSFIGRLCYKQWLLLTRSMDEKRYG